MAIDPFFLQLGLAVAQSVTRGGPRRQYKWNKKAADDAQAVNRDNAMWALEENRKLQQEQRVYDSPENQMARYKAAGLNPHLIYGSGSSSAGGAFPISTQGIAPYRVDAPNASYPDVAGSFMQAGQTLAQTNLAEAKTAESGYKQEALSIQNAIARANPMLDPGVADWVARSLEETARLKAIESRQWLSKSSEGLMRAQEKINGELEQMFQKIGLNAVDQNIRNKILESKEFENAIKEIQVNWLKDAEITPQHIYQGILMLLTKML